MSGDFTPEQKRYLEGFTAGLQVARRGRATTAAAPVEPSGPDAIHLRAQDRVLKASQKLNEQERWKRDEHPFDAYARFKAQAANDEYPKPADTFRWKYYGLFYTAPAQNSYMCRLRMPNGILAHWQLAGLADVAERYGGGYSHVTTRANLQIREIEAKNAVAMIEAIQDLGLCSRGSGADNIRNVTGTPTAGIDPQELIDTRPYAREWHHHILNDRSLYGLPRKFNVAFDGAGLVPVLEDTNDIGFQAVAVKDGFGVAPGVWFRLMLGGITGHKDFAHATKVLVKPADATRVADAVVRVFIDEGDRTNRNKARLKYVIDRLGVDKVLALTEEKLGHQLLRVPAVRSRRARPSIAAPYRRRCAETGGPQLDRRRAAVGKLTVARCARSPASPARSATAISALPSGKPPDLGRSDCKLAEALDAIAAADLSASTTSIRAGLVACNRQQPLPLAPPPTPSAMPRRSRAGAKRGSNSTPRSTSILPAAIIPAPSTISAISGFSPARSPPPKTATRWRATISSSAAASDPTPASHARFCATCKRRTRQPPSNVSSDPTWRSDSHPRKAFSPSPGAIRSRHFGP